MTIFRGWYNIYILLKYKYIIYFYGLTLDTRLFAVCFAYSYIYLKNFISSNDVISAVRYIEVIHLLSIEMEHR